ncbi:IS4 family transposase [Phytohabitans flavus]|uniref:IS4 family transposase n=1 Tax=Phytohabitans flavus TaxID=1076124 RepID=UPI001566BEF3|nr:IS4 family transposase [Phytohabitans flavus]
MVVFGAGGRLTDWVSVGVLAGSVPRDVVDAAVAVYGRESKRSDGKLPAHVMVYFAMALALFAEDDYEGVLARLAEPLMAWGCWDASWSMPGSAGITQARQRLGAEPVREVFERVARPVCGVLTRGAWLAGRRLVSVDGSELDVPDSPANAEFFGYAGGATRRSAFPKARLVTLVETGSRAPIGAVIGPVVGKGQGEQSLARGLYPLLEPGMLLLADRNFYGWRDWCAATDTGADVLWRAGGAGGAIALPVVQDLPDGSYLTVVYASRTRPSERDRILALARDPATRADIDPHRARIARVVSYQVTDRADNDEPISLLTSILDPADAPAAVLAEAYHQRWDHETSNGQLKTHLRGPGRVLRSKSPAMVTQEIYGYLLTHYAISALICQAATEADIDPDQVKFHRTVRILRRRVQDPTAFSP